MGAAYYIVLEKPLAGLDTMMDGMSLSWHMETLDVLARQMGVRPLSEFFSMGPEELAEFLEGPVESESPPLRQFAAREGLATVKALLARPEARAAWHDLRDCERILTAAAEQGVAWHFQADV
jgi:hypothetical protein